MNKIWFDKEWNDYLYWQSQDKKTLKRMFEMWKGIHLMVLGNLNL